MISACAGTKRAAPGSDQGRYDGVPIEEPHVSQETVEEVFGPEPPATEAADAPAEPEAAPAPPVDPKLCLVLGPGMAKALAHASVLEAIRKERIPVHCVVGTEMGAVVGALYSQAKGSTNSLQWQLFKFNRDNYFNFPMLSLREPKSTGRKLNGFLRGLFKSRTIETLPIRFGTAAAAADRGEAVAFVSGDLVSALSATLAMPEIFEPWEVGGEALASGAVANPYPLDIAKSLGGNFFVVVDVMEDGGGRRESDRFQKAFSPVKNLARLQKRDASFVIEVKAGHIPFDDFSRQGEILAAGTRAAEESVPELKAAWEKWIAGQR